jgi:hypothetical protein
LVGETAVGEGLLHVMQVGKIKETASNNLHSDIHEDMEPRQTTKHVQYAFM